MIKKTIVFYLVTLGLQVPLYSSQIQNPLLNTSTAGLLKLTFQGIKHVANIAEKYIDNNPGKIGLATGLALGATGWWLKGKYDQRFNERREQKEVILDSQQKALFLASLQDRICSRIIQHETIGRLYLIPHSLEEKVEGREGTTRSLMPICELISNDLYKNIVDLVQNEPTIGSTLAQAGTQILTDIATGTLKAKPTINLYNRHITPIIINLQKIFIKIGIFKPKSLHTVKIQQITPDHLNRMIDKLLSNDKYREIFENRFYKLPQPQQAPTPTRNEIISGYINPNENIASRADYYLIQPLNKYAFQPFKNFINALMMGDRAHRQSIASRQRSSVPVVDVTPNPHTPQPNSSTPQATNTSASTALSTPPASTGCVALVPTSAAQVQSVEQAPESPRSTDSSHSSTSACFTEQIEIARNLEEELNAVARAATARQTTPAHEEEQPIVDNGNANFANSSGWWHYAHQILTRTKEMVSNIE